MDCGMCIYFKFIYLQFVKKVLPSVPELSWFTFCRVVINNFNNGNLFI